MTATAKRSQGKIQERLLDRLVEAVITGEPCKTSDVGPRRVPALSPQGLGYLTRHDAWQEAMQRIVNLNAHAGAQRRFLETWERVGYALRKHVGDDNLFFAALRVLMPPYEGPPMTLYRGQLRDYRPEPSWTRSHHIAYKFALFGTDNVDPIKLIAQKKPVAGRSNAVILQGTAHREIISAPCLFGFAEGEYVVDPRCMAFVATAP